MRPPACSGSRLATVRGVTAKCEHLDWRYAALSALYTAPSTLACNVLFPSKVMPAALNNANTKKSRLSAGSSV